MCGLCGPSRNQRALIPLFLVNAIPMRQILRGGKASRSTPLAAEGQQHSGQQGSQGEFARCFSL